MKNKYKFLTFGVNNTITNSCSQITRNMTDALNNLKKNLIFINETHAPELKKVISSKLK